MLFRSSMVLAALLTFTAGCQLPAAAVSDNPVGEDAYSVTDIQGTKVNMPGKPHRILTLSMSTDEVVLGLVRPDHMAAVNSLLDDPVSSNVVDLAAQVEGRVKDPTVEEIAAMEPETLDDLDGCLRRLRDVQKARRELAKVPPAMLLSGLLDRRSRGGDPT